MNTARFFKKVTNKVTEKFSRPKEEMDEIYDFDELLENYNATVVPRPDECEPGSEYSKIVISDSSDKESNSGRKFSYAEVYAFEDYDEYKEFFEAYAGREVDDELLDSLIFKTMSDGEIAVYRIKCNRLLADIRTEEFLKQYTPEKIRELHSEGKLAPPEKFEEWWHEKEETCAPKSVGTKRCHFFRHDCRKCLREWATGIKEYRATKNESQVTRNIEDEISTIEI